MIVFTREKGVISENSVIVPAREIVSIKLQSKDGTGLIDIVAGNDHVVEAGSDILCRQRADGSYVVYGTINFKVETKGGVENHSTLPLIPIQGE